MTVAESSVNLGAVLSQDRAPVEAITRAHSPRKLLFISFDFPPQRTSAIYRHVGLLRYLGRYGWKAQVLTVAGKEGDIQDAAMLHKLPADVRVVRSGFLKVDAWERAANKVSRQLRNADAVAAPATQAAPPTGWRARLRNLLRGVAEWMRIFLYFPDNTSGWIIPGFMRALELHLRERFDLVYTTSPPKSAAVIGLLLKKVIGVQWVCEFRDPWYRPVSRLKTVMQRKLQEIVIRNADKIVVISEGNAEHLTQRFGLPPGKVVVVPNGYDEDDFQSLPEPTANRLDPGYVHFSHFGSIYPNFSGEFFPALAEVLAEHPGWRERMRINIVGFPDERSREECALYGLEPVVRFIPFVPHLESLRLMEESDCLLLFLSNKTTSRLSGLGKIYWYLRVSRPVLAVAYPGGCQRLVDEGKAGWVAFTRQEIKEALMTAMGSAGNGGAPRPAPAFVEQFRYDRIAGRLAGVLDSVVNR